VNEEVAHAARSVARAACLGDAAAGKTADVAAALAAAVDVFVRNDAPPCDHAQDRARGGVIALYAHVASAHFADDASPEREPALKRAMAAFRTLHDGGCYIAAKEIAPFARTLPPVVANAMAAAAKTTALTAADARDRRAAAAGLAGIVAGLASSERAVADMKLVDAVVDALAAKKDPIARAGACALYAHLCRTAGRAFEPFAIDLASKMFIAQGDQSPEVREAADAAQAAVVKALPLTAMKLLAPALVEAMTHKTWQAKCGALTVCGDLASRVPAYFMRNLPEIFPAFLECVFDTHPKVSHCAGRVMRPICSCVKNAEIVGMLDLIIEAIREPQSQTESCLDRLMETTFVNSMDAPSLAGAFYTKTFHPPLGFNI